MASAAAAASSSLSPYVSGSTPQANTAFAGSTPYSTRNTTFSPGPPLARLDGVNETPAAGQNGNGSRHGGGDGVMDTPQPFSMTQNAGHTPGARPTGELDAL